MYKMLNTTLKIINFYTSKFYGLFDIKWHGRGKIVEIRVRG
jgi:hypothetical protein